MAKKTTNTRKTTPKKPAAKSTGKKTTQAKTTKTQKTHTKADKQRFIQVLNKKDGHVSKACDAFGIDRKTYYNWMKEDWFKEEVEEVREKEIDDTEEIARMMRKGVPTYMRDKQGNLVYDKNGKPIVEKWLIKPDSKMVRHFLDTQGKERGYGKQVGIDINIHKMPEDVSIGLKVHKKKK